MSSSTALLPKKKKDHPIFMRVCHSSWPFIGHKSLVNLRAVVAAYILGSFIALINYDINKLHLGWKTIFKLSNIAYLLLVIFHLLAATWSYMHLHYPHHASQPRSFKTRLQKALSAPRQNPKTKNRDWFSIFYFAGNAFTLVQVGIYWAVLFPTNKTTIPTSRIFKDDYTTFYVFAKHGINALIAIIEIFFLNGHIRSTPIKDHPKRISWHIVAFLVLTWLYIGWAYLGYHITGVYNYPFFDFRKYGAEYTWSSLIIFTAAVQGAALFIWLLTALKEKLTSKRPKNNGYQILPQ